MVCANVQSVLLLSDPEELWKECCRHVACPNFSVEVVKYNPRDIPVSAVTSNTVNHWSECAEELVELVIWMRRGIGWIGFFYLLEMWMVSHKSGLFPHYLTTFWRFVPFGCFNWLQAHCQVPLPKNHVSISCYIDIFKNCRCTLSFNKMSLFKKTSQDKIEGKHDPRVYY